MTDIANNMGQIIEAHNFGSKKKKRKYLAHMSTYISTKVILQTNNVLRSQNVIMKTINSFRAVNFGSFCIS